MIEDYKEGLQPLTREPIAGLPPLTPEVIASLTGRSLDAAVWQAMGNTPADDWWVSLDGVRHEGTGPLPASSDWNAMAAVLTWLRSRGWWLAINTLTESSGVRITLTRTAPLCRFKIQAPSLPVGVCRAALLATLAAEGENR
jgi:hypothetical protein